MNNESGEDPSLWAFSIFIQDQRWEKKIPALEDLVYLTLKVSGSFFPFIHHPTETSLVFADDSFLHNLNLTYRGKDTPTNVLSFPGSDFQKGMKFIPLEGIPVPLGDIVLSYDTIERESVEQNKSFTHHLQHLLVHGFLHLWGFDHVEDADALEMESLEIKILNKLNIENPYREILCHS
jgi:probable rRNA maturation factor